MVHRVIYWLRRLSCHFGACNSDSKIQDLTEQSVPMHESNDQRRVSTMVKIVSISLSFCICIFARGNHEPLGTRNLEAIQYIRPVMVRH